MFRLPRCLHNVFKTPSRHLERRKIVTLHNDKNRQTFCDFIRFWLYSTSLQQQKLLMYLHDAAECVCLKGDRIQNICFDWPHHGRRIKTLFQLLKIEDYCSRFLQDYYYCFFYSNQKQGFLSQDNFSSFITTSRRLQNVFKTFSRCLQDVLENQKLCVLGDKKLLH